MQLFILYPLFFLLLVVSLLILYILSKNDFVLLRKNISLEKIFDVFFLSFMFSFIASRLFYIADTFSFQLLHPLQFFHVIKLTGLSFFGFILGVFLFVFLYFRKKRATFRIFDIYSLAFYPLFIFNIFAIHLSGYFFIIQVVLALLLIGLYVFLVRSHKNFTLSDGGVFSVFIFLSAVLNLVINFFTKKHLIIYVFSFSQLVSMIFVIIALFLFLLSQKKHFLKK